MRKVIDAHIHICRCISGFGEGGEMQAIGGGWAQYADGTKYQMIPPCLGETGVTPEAALAQMDAAGVERAVMLQGNFLGLQNLYTYAAAQKYPGRLLAAAAYDPFCRHRDAIRAHLFEELGIGIVKFEVSTGSGLMSYHPTIPLDGEVMEEALSYAGAHGQTVVFDIGRRGSACWQPQALARAISRHPDTQFVVCHLLAPQGRGYEEEWRAGFTALAQDNVVFDLASLPANQRPERYPYPTAVWFIAEAIRLAGSSRLLWGSDLPMNLCRDTYRHLIDYIDQCADFTQAQKDALLYQNAKRVYFKGE